MFFTKGRKYTIITEERVNLLVEQGELKICTHLINRAYRHREAIFTAYLPHLALNKTFTANNDTDEISQQCMDDYTSCYTIYPWMCKEYYTSLMETE